LEKFLYFHIMHLCCTKNTVCLHKTIELSCHLINILLNDCNFRWIFFLSFLFNSQQKKCVAYPLVDFLFDRWFWWSNEKTYRTPSTQRNLKLLFTKYRSKNYQNRSGLGLSQTVIWPKVFYRKYNDAFHA
jgi:hypothetical protein